MPKVRTGEPYAHVEPGEPGNTKDYRICGAPNRKDELGHGICQNQAGHGTDHLGEGRCKYHGGSRILFGPDHGRFTTGLKAEGYQDRVRRAFLEKSHSWNEFGDPTDLLAELEVQRHLFYMYLTRAARQHGVFIDIDASDDVMRLPDGRSVDELKELEVDFEDFVKNVFVMVGEIAKVTKTITAQRKDHASLADLDNIREVMKDALEIFVPENRRHEAVEWIAERLPHKRTPG